MIVLTKKVTLLLLLVVQAFLNTFLSASVKLNVYDEPVFDIALYPTSSFEPVSEIQASRLFALLPAGFE